MSRHKVEITGVNTSNIKVLTSEETKELFDLYRKGDLSAREKIVDGNLKLVLSILKIFSNSEENKDDLFQIGCVGLLKAVDNFDPSYGVKFSTYCVPMILGEIRRYVRDNSSIRVSRSLKDLSYRSLKAKDELSISLGRVPKEEEIAKYLGVDEFSVVDALDSRRAPVSLFEPIYSDGGDTIYLCDQIEDKKTNGTNLDIKIAIDEAINDLDERDRYVLDQRFIVGKTQLELAEELDISQAQVSRIEKKVIDTLKKKVE
ncbi:MAG: SigB/SigF/SigG family RNA polymerase sigma factor [Bacilli bacterium]|nr:SigB/SigF/SigG family RNA polymerase sigma factor [Bacilli bacterium]